MPDAPRKVRYFLAGAALAGAVARRMQRAAIEQLREAIRTERLASRKLRDEAHAAQQQASPVAEGDDVRDLVLRTAMGLLDAQKGVLLSRTDADKDGDFDMVCAHGFPGDPEHLPVVQRFAGRVLELDEMVIEDHVADPQITNLVAVPVYMFGRFDGVVLCADRPGGFSAVDDNVLLALGDHAGAALHSQRLHREMRDTNRGVVQMLADLLANADAGRSASAVEGATLAAALARRLGLEDAERDAVVCAAALRDIGLVAIPDAVLAKAGPLTPAERAVVQRHCQVAFEVIGHLRDLRDVAFAVLYHHERYDGQGYPAGLVGEAIPRAARIVAVVDAYCAITRDRPYRTARAGSEAVAELADLAGAQFDPGIVHAFAAELADPQLRSLDAGTAEAVTEWLLLPDRATPQVADGLAAGIDSLTQLGAHRVFREEVAAAAADGPFTVLLMELEALGATNDRDGYAAGDRLLATAARKLQRVAAGAGLAAYRDGGARFGVVARGYDAVAGQRLLDEVNAEFSLGPAVRVAVAAAPAGQRGDAAIAAALQRLRAAELGVPGDLDKVE